MKQTIAITMMLAATLFLGGLQMALAQTTYTAGAALVADEAGDRGNDVPAITSDGRWRFGTKASSIGIWTIMPSTWHVDSFGFGKLQTTDNAFAGWAPDNCQTGNESCVPMIAVNTTSVDQGWSPGDTTFAPSKFWVHPNQTGSGTGPCVAVRWTAPVDGTADVSAVWEGKHDCGGGGDGVTTHVTINGALLPGSQPDGAIPLLNTPLIYNANGETVMAGDNIDFVTCPNTQYSCDSTQFDAMVTLTPAAEPLTCMGFLEPFDHPIYFKGKKTNRNLPLKFSCVDGSGIEVDDEYMASNGWALPVVNVVFSASGGGTDPGFEIDLQPCGLATEGNEFFYNGEHWMLVLGLKAYTAEGEYTISAVPGDGNYTMDVSETYQKLD